MPTRICLIDDDFMVRDALTLGLRDAGYEVHPVPGAAAGFDVASRIQIDAIVTDMNMPGTNGAQFIPEARLAWPDTPIIAISGQSIVDGRPLKDVACGLGANTAISKPFRVRQLVETLEALLSERKASSRTD